MSVVAGPTNAVVNIFEVTQKTAMLPHHYYMPGIDTWILSIGEMSSK
jgi:hypothetical protein